MKYFLLCLCFISTFAFARFPSNGTDGATTSLVSLEQFPRVLSFSEEQIQMSESGVIYICMLPAARKVVQTDRSFKTICVSPKTPTVDDAWIPLEKISIAGFQASHYQMVISGSYSRMTIFLYFQKVQ